LAQLVCHVPSSSIAHLQVLAAEQAGELDDVLSVAQVRPPSFQPGALTFSNGLFIASYLSRWADHLARSL
jgi:hypothetical protein